MLRLEFSESDQQALNYERYHPAHPRVQQRMEALWLKSQGIPHHQIARLCRISGNILRAYLKQYQAGGVDALTQVSFHRPQSALKAHRQTIEAHLREHSLQTIHESRRRARNPDRYPPEPDPSPSVSQATRSDMP